MSWNAITKRIEKFINEHADVPFDIQITNHPPEGNLIKVSMTAHLELEEDDGLGKNYKRIFTTWWNNDQKPEC